MKLIGSKISMASLNHSLCVKPEHHPYRSHITSSTQSRCTSSSMTASKPYCILKDPTVSDIFFHGNHTQSFSQSIPQKGTLKLCTSLHNPLGKSKIAELKLCSKFATFKVVEIWKRKKIGIMVMISTSYSPNNRHARDFIITPASRPQCEWSGKDIGEAYLLLLKHRTVAAFFNFPFAVNGPESMHGEVRC
jgi:hypothetical protein